MLSPENITKRFSAGHGQARKFSLLRRGGMSAKAKWLKVLTSAGLATLAFQCAGAQTGQAKATVVTPDVARTIKAAADALGMPRTGGPGGMPRASAAALIDRKSTRLNSSHSSISYAVFCLKKKKKKKQTKYE